MVPASPDLAAWLAAELSLVLLEDGERGEVRVLSGRQEGDTSLLSASCRAAGVPGLEGALEELIGRAREGVPGALALAEDDAQGRVLAWGVGGGRARVLVAPTAGVVARRAAAADLAAGVTHEVANALTAIAGWTRMASNGGPLPDRTRQALDVVQRSARDALGSARELLTTMRDSARPAVAAVETETPDAGALIREVVETLRPELDEADVEVVLALEERVAARATPSALRSIVGNLVRNAYDALSAAGRGGSLRVTLSSDARELLLTVEDDGPGMDPDTLRSAFERYFTTKRRGTGLGLALVRDLVIEAGGRVEVESHRGRGTKFEVVLPAALAAAPVAEAEGETARSAPGASRGTRSGTYVRPWLRGRRVLVVDDDAAMRSMIRTLLELHGAHDEDAGSVAEARTVEGDHDLVLVDLSLGDGRGDALLAELQREGRVRHAIVLTGSTDPVDEAARPDAVLRKPFELEDLQRALEGILRLGSRAAEER